MLYFLYSNSILTFYIDVVLTFSIHNCNNITLTFHHISGNKVTSTVREHLLFISLLPLQSHAGSKTINNVTRLQIIPLHTQFWGRMLKSSIHVYTCVYCWTVVIALTRTCQYKSGYTVIYACRWQSQVQFYTWNIAHEVICLKWFLTEHAGQFAHWYFPALVRCLRLCNDISWPFASLRKAKLSCQLPPQPINIIFIS